MTEVLQDLTTQSLQALSASLKSGPLSVAVTISTLQQIAGDKSERLSQLLNDLRNQGLQMPHVALIVDAIIATRQRSVVPENILELVLSGPDLEAIPTSDTSASMHSVIEQASIELLLVGYVVHNAKALFQHVADKIKSSPAMKLILCLDIPRQYGDTSIESEIVKRFARDFATTHWPWRPLPDLLYDPRSLNNAGSHHSSLHAKCIVADRKVALVTSANFTEAAQLRNIELGLIVRHEPIARRIAEYFEGLRATRQMLQIQWE